MAELTSVWGAAFLVAAVLVVAALVNFFAPGERKHLRRTITLLALFALSFASAKALGALGRTAWARPILIAAEVLGFFTLVATGGVVLFHLALPALRVRPPRIAVELVMGAAYFVGALLVLRRFGLDPASLLATSAVLTGILALSLQATLGNVIGGVALQLDNSIRVGDWVQLENGRQGVVREIRWRHTVIETRDWDTLIVPNALLLQSAFTILGKRQGQPLQHRMWVYFNVDFRFGPTEVIRVVEEALRAAPIDGVACEPPPSCVCMDFARDRRDSMAYYAVRFLLNDLANDDPTASRVRARVYTALKRADIPLAVPATHVWVEQDSPERRARKAEREMDRRRQALRTVSFLAPLRDDEMADLADRLRYAPFTAGETVTRQGAVAHWLYILTEGTAEVRVTKAQGTTQTVATLVGPDFVGEMGLMTGEPRSASVVAVSDVECYRLDKDAFRAILAQRPTLAAEVTALIAARQVELHARQGAELEAGPRSIDDEKLRLLSAVRRFFGLDDTQA
jgi:small-conductance mechanosensitive channel/CRP-like cAMP-binding protein